VKTISERYIQYYKPLVHDFIREVGLMKHPDIDWIPEPFFPVFGSKYKQSALRLVIIGQDTPYWWDLRKFIAAERKEPGSKLREKVEFFGCRQFSEWNFQKQIFWGGAMMFLATLHGRENWEAMKEDELTGILDSFGWGKCNAVALHETVKGKGVQADYWEEIRQAGAGFNLFCHLVEIMKPNVAVILSPNLDQAYFNGCQVEKVFQDGQMTHYRLAADDIDVFHAPHLGSMNRLGGSEKFREKMRECFLKHGHPAVFPEFFHSQREGDNAVKILMKAPPHSSFFHDKFDFVAWLAHQLRMRNCFMSEPALCDLLNARGYLTDDKKEFNREAGCDMLINSTYHRALNPQYPKEAESVALAFHHPSREYSLPIKM
jgi:hypothetical protein